MNYHKHRCHWCAFVWEHHDANDAHHNASPLSHACPACHRCNWGLGIYEGAEPAKARNGKDPGPAVLGSIHPDQAVRTL
jgi:hypothetical protein